MLEVFIPSNTPSFQFPHYKYFLALQFEAVFIVGDMEGCQGKDIGRSNYS